MINPLAPRCLLRSAVAGGLLFAAYYTRMNAADSRPNFDRPSARPDARPTARPSARLCAALDAIAAGAQVCHWAQSRLLPAWQLTKSDASPVTIADLACQAVVSRQLRAQGLLNELGLHAEESSDSLGNPAIAALVLGALTQSQAWPDATLSKVAQAIDDAALPDLRRLSELGPLAPATTSISPPPAYWTLDPIDGTKGFIAGRGYAVCLALIENGRPTLCALACPKLPLLGDATGAPGSVIAAERAGPDALWSPLFCYPFTAGSPIPTTYADIAPSSASTTPRLSTPRPPVPRWTSGLDRSARDIRLLEALVGQIGGDIALAIDSQAKYAAIAIGMADIYLRPAPRAWTMKAWDHAAGLGLCEAAGLTTSDLLGAPLDFSRGCSRSGQGILVAPPTIHPRIIAAARNLPDAFAPEPGTA